MKLNASKTKTMIISGSRTMHPQSPALTFGGIVLKESDDLVLLGVTFEKHLRSASRAASQWLGILKSCQVFHDRLLLGRCSLGFVQHVLEYCSAVWCSAVNTHLKHRVDSIIESSLGSKIMHLFIRDETFVR